MERYISMTSSGHYFDPAGCLHNWIEKVVILKIWNRKTWCSHRHGPTRKTTQKTRQMEAEMTSKSAPEMVSLRMPQLLKNALFSLCFRTKRSLPGPPKGLPKGTPQGIQKGARNEATKGADTGIAFKIVIIMKICNAESSGFTTYPGHICSSPPERPMIELKI